MGKKVKIFISEKTAGGRHGISKAARQTVFPVTDTVTVGLIRRRKKRLTVQGRLF